MSEEQQNVHYQVVRGFSCPVSEQFTRDKMEKAMDFMPDDDDLILASYPKTGTVWMQYILLQIKSKGMLFPTFHEASNKIVPFIEKVGVDAVNAQDKPRFYKHHIAYNFVHKNEKSKCIYMYRHPEDTVVSYYHFIRSVIQDFPLDFGAFFNNFVTGNISYGSYFQHVLSFYEHRDDNNLLMVSYEKLQNNRRDEILKIAKFLGEEYHQSLLDDDALLNKIMEHTSFDYMKMNLHFNQLNVRENLKRQSTDKSEVNFFRKGVIGDGKNALTSSQRQFLKDTAEKVLKETSIMNEWYS